MKKIADLIGSQLLKKKLVLTYKRSHCNVSCTDVEHSWRLSKRWNDIRRLVLWDSGKLKNWNVLPTYCPPSRLTIDEYSSALFSQKLFWILINSLFVSQCKCISKS